MNKYTSRKTAQSASNREEQECSPVKVFECMKERLIHYWVVKTIWGRYI